MKRFLATFLSMTMVLVFAGCNSSPAGGPETGESGEAPGPSQSAEHGLSIGTASLGGNFFTMGASIAAVVIDETGYRAVAQASGGSASNVIEVSMGDLDAGITQATSIAAAMRGTDQFEGNPIDNITTLVNWNATPVHIMVRRSLGAEDIADLDGQSIECITPGDGIELTTKMFVEAYGISDIKMEYSGNRVQSTSRFKTGGVDAIFDATGLGAAWIADIIGDGSEFELLSLGEDQVEAIVEIFPELGPMVIPAGTYRGQEEDVITVGNWTTLIANETMDEDVAYHVVKAILENKEALVNGHSFFADLDGENIVDACVAPLHPGAERYYKEIGVLS